MHRPGVFPTTWLMYGIGPKLGRLDDENVARGMMDDGVGHAAQQASGALHAHVSDHDQRRTNLTCDLQNDVFGLTLVDHTGGLDAVNRTQAFGRPLGELGGLARFTEHERVTTDAHDVHGRVAVCARHDEASVEGVSQLGGSINGLGSGFCIGSSDNDHFRARSSMNRVTHVDDRSGHQL